MTENTQEIRNRFLTYFKKHDHTLVASSPVIPHDDPTLLFNNAGMNQFKDVFLGRTLREYKRAATSQKCIRAGGKHNDLENVGHTRRHLTFFEMLGNFSFGDYFKEEAISFAWQVSTEVFNLPPEKIWPTVFRDDDEAFDIWTGYVPAERITRLGEKDNFWAMGDTGPCGPSSELLFDRGEEYGSAPSPLEDSSGERFMEFWNLVFMQYNRTAGGTLEKLPRPSIDTGAGLERIMGLIQNVDTVFETDILRSIIARTEEVLKVKYNPTAPDSAAFRVIADHLRSLAFAIADGAQPSNVDRGYVLRKILRRAVRYSRQLTSVEEPFLAKILPRLIEQMGSDYRELHIAEARIAEILTLEEEAFLRTLRRGQNMLGQIIESGRSHGKQISGDEAFKLKDTYGFPLDEILLIAKDADLTVDEKRYQQLEQEARERSRKMHKGTQQVASENLFDKYIEEQGETNFTGYTDIKSASIIKGIVVDGAFVGTLRAGQEGTILLDKTPFYAEMGGQIGDTGTLFAAGGQFLVYDTQSPYKGIIGHIGTVTQGELHLQDRVTATIDAPKRQKIANNHTATHLLHWALHEVLGGHIKQGGSVVETERLRFDFSHHKPLSAAELRSIEDKINDKIRENREVKSYEIDYADVQGRQDIKQFFGEKYGKRVRVVDLDYSKELCGGTHTFATGSIGLFRIAKEGSIAAGIRRIEAVTGLEAEAITRDNERLIESIAAQLKCTSLQLSERVNKLVEENVALAKELQEAKKEQMAAMIKELLSKVEKIGTIPLLMAKLNINPSELKAYSEEAALRLQPGIVVFAIQDNDKSSFIIRISDDLVAKGIKAGDLVQAILPIVEGKGGGKPNAAQAGGKYPERIPEALAQVRALLNTK